MKLHETRLTPQIVAHVVMRNMPHPHGRGKENRDQVADVLGLPVETISDWVTTYRDEILVVIPQIVDREWGILHASMLHDKLAKYLKMTPEQVNDSFRVFDPGDLARILTLFADTAKGNKRLREGRINTTNLLATIQRLPRDMAPSWQEWVSDEMGLPESMIREWWDELRQSVQGMCLQIGDHLDPDVLRLFAATPPGKKRYRVMLRAVASAMGVKPELLEFGLYVEESEGWKRRPPLIGDMIHGCYQAFNDGVSKLEDPINEVRITPERYAQAVAANFTHGPQEEKIADAMGIPVSDLQAWVSAAKDDIGAAIHDCEVEDFDDPTNPQPVLRAAAAQLGISTENLCAICLAIPALISAVMTRTKDMAAYFRERRGVAESLTEAGNTDIGELS